jgi:hypothetical protein
MRKCCPVKEHEPGYRGKTMPLAFDSISHGTIAFGFFNIESDMLLLEHYFFFVTEFCEYVSEIAEKDGKDDYETLWEVYHIKDPEDIGDLMGAIHGVRYTGFIGELYRRFPFPKRPEDFKQKPEGFKNRAVVEEVIGEYAEVRHIPFIITEKAQEVGLGAYRFARTSFQELIKYVWRGGYPRWKDEVRPDCVSRMKSKIVRSHNGLLEGIIFEGEPDLRM